MGTHSRLAVILHADVVASTTLVQKDERVAHDRIRDAFRHFSEVIARHGGTTHEVRGDALVAEFSKASDSVSAAAAFQAAHTEHLRGVADEIRPELRVGIAMGEVVIADGTITGEGVVLAQRLEQLAEAGGVCIQGAAYETIPKRLPFRFDSLGERTLKGFDEPVRAYTVHARTDDVSPASSHVTGANVATPRPPDRSSIAVLPFTNISGDPEQDYFADGIAEDIITGLARFRSLSVIARNTSFAYRGQRADVRQVGSELGVRYVLEGSVRRAGGKVRVTAQLIDVATGNHIWAERYDGDFADIFTLQDRFTQSIVGSIVPEISTAEIDRAAQKRGSDTEAYAMALRAIWKMRKGAERSDQELRNEGLVLAQHAIQRDPESIEAWKAQAFFYQLELVFGGSTPREDALRLARQSAERVTAIDIEEPAGYCSLGLAKFYSGQFDEGIADLEHARALNPNDSLPIGYLAWIKAMAGRKDEALVHADEAIRICPRHFRVVGVAHFARALVAFQEGEYQSAVDFARRAIQAQPAAPMRYGILAASLLELGKPEEAREAVMQLAQRRPHFLDALFRGEYTVFREESENRRYIETVRKIAEGLPEMRS